jgi:hypothetical protein
MGEVASAVGAISSIGSAISNLGGGKSSGGTAGLTPQQAALAQYQGDQQTLANAQRFSQGLGHSTGLTYADAGTGIGTATQAAGMADINAQGQNTLANAAQQAGFGTSTGSFGSGSNTSTGSTDSSTNTTPDVSTG